MGIVSFETTASMVASESSEKLDNLNLFSQPTAVEYDNLGYHASLNVNESDINAETDFGTAWNSELNG